eukprot:s2038_g5.t1
MTKAEVIAVIHSVVSASGIPLTREGIIGMVQRFGGRVLRVSGAQFLAQSCCWDVGVDAQWSVMWDAAAVEFKTMTERMSPSERSGVTARQLAGPADASKATSSAELLAKIEQLAAAVERLQIRPALVIGKSAHLRDPEESTALPAMRRTKCGWCAVGPTSQGETSLVRTSVGSAPARKQA